ncbi:hypothetical protein D3C77_520990 [compost metagenome]
MQSCFVSFSDSDYKEVWDRFYTSFKFKPSVYSKDWPSFQLPSPYITYDISQHHSQDFLDDLDEKGMKCLQAITAQDESIYDLDWHHTCYHFYPHLPRKRFNHLTPFYPDGDYYIFLHKDFKWGYLGHPWEESISLFGEEIIKVFEANKPQIFGKVIWQSGLED